MSSGNTGPVDAGGLLMYVSYLPVCVLIGSNSTRLPALRSVNGSKIEVGLVIENRGPCVLGAFPCFQLISSLAPGPAYQPIAVCERGWDRTEV